MEIFLMARLVPEIKPGYLQTRSRYFKIGKRLHNAGKSLLFIGMKIFTNMQPQDANIKKYSTPVSLAAKTNV
jgi:hypothetical protein